MPDPGLRPPTAARGIVLFAHGSRDPMWRAPVEAVATRLRQRDPSLTVGCAYLELNDPDLPSADDAMVAAGCRHVHVLPLFLGVGRHAREDLPRLVDALRRRHPALQLTVAPAVGEDERVLDLLADIARSGLS